MIHLNLLHILSIIDLTIFFLFPMDIFNKYLSCQNVEKNIGDQLFIEKICLGIHFLAFYESRKVYNSIS